MRALTGWGRYPVAQNRLQLVQHRDALLTAVQSASRGEGRVIARGLGRSYGDSALAASGIEQHSVLELTALKHLIAFDASTGILTAEAGISLAELIEVFLPQGWFLPVTPGTKWVTLGGAVASDVHGKNHHQAGSFGNHVRSLDILLGSGEVVTASRTEHADLFAATIGGMGLTGIIVTVTVQLQRMPSSNIHQRTIKAANLDAVLDGFETHSSAPFSVAWLDALSNGKRFGRSLLMVGDYAEDQTLQLAGSTKLRVPTSPLRLVNPLTSTLFNQLYFHKERRAEHSAIIGYDAYFYQLDAVHDWPGLYGRDGFVQYQFALPEGAGREGLRAILAEVVASGLATPITVLKQFGAGNSSPLSFPIAGYTLAIDFPATRAVFTLLDRLDTMVAEYGGRVYLTKDARMSSAHFQRFYPRWQEFQAVRSEYGASGIFASAQSERLGLEEFPGQ